VSAAHLCARDLVDVIANQGAFVATWPSSEMVEVYGLRAVLEGRAAELAATRLTHAQLDDLRTLAVRMEQAVASDDDDRLAMVAQMNDQFHRLIANAAGSQRLAAGIAALVDIPLALNTYARYSHEQLLRSMHHHRELISALDERDPPWARAAMECHILAGRAVYARSAH
jgi:DNA-binding GntR family transcriptional regulator